MWVGPLAYARGSDFFSRSKAGGGREWGSSEESPLRRDMPGGGTFCPVTDLGNRGVKRALVRHRKIARRSH